LLGLISPETRSGGQVGPPAGPPAGQPVGGPDSRIR
jgi:hypothetical protein